MFKALIIQEDSKSREMLQKTLARYAQCHLALDGDEALNMFKDARARRRAYDIICLDICAPGIDGRTLLQEMRAIEGRSGNRSTKKCKFIMTTSLSDCSVASLVSCENCDEYLVKPINKHKLLQHLYTFGLLPVRLI